MPMSQSLQRLWQAVFTVVGGDRRWLATPLTPPSHGRRKGGDRTHSVTTADRPAGGGTGQEDSAGRSDEAILAALADNGGRLDQRDIPEAADLSQSTVSRRLIAMEERGEVNRYELGRRKVVFVPGAEPDAFDSPLSGEESPRETPT